MPFTPSLFGGRLGTLSGFTSIGLCVQGYKSLCVYLSIYYLLRQNLLQSHVNKTIAQDQDQDHRKCPRDASRQHHWCTELLVTVCCADDFQLTAAMSLLKMVVSADEDLEADVHSEPAATPSTATATTDVLDVDDALSQCSADELDLNNQLQTADDVTDDVTQDDVIADSSCCLEDDVENDYGADTTDYDARNVENYDTRSVLKYTTLVV